MSLYEVRVLIPSRPGLAPRIGYDGEFILEEDADGRTLAFLADPERIDMEVNRSFPTLPFSDNGLGLLAVRAYDISQQKPWRGLVHLVSTFLKEARAKAVHHHKAEGSDPRAVLDQFSTILRRNGYTPTQEVRGTYWTTGLGTEECVVRLLQAPQPPITCPLDGLLGA